MRAKQAMALPANLRQRADCIGMGFGLLAFPIAFFDLASIPSGPPGVILPMMILGTVAAMVACALGRSDGWEGVGGFALRFGLRSGIVATLTGGALTVLAPTLHALGIGPLSEGAPWPVEAAAILPATRPSAILLITVLGIPPSIFFGMAGALIVAVSRDAPPSSALDVRMPPPTDGSRLRHGCFTAVVVLCVVGYLSPIAVPLFVKPLVVAPPAETPPQKWRYRAPTGFREAETERIVIGERRSLGTVIQRLPFAISPDQHRFACCQDEAKVVIFDLDSLVVVASTTLPQAPLQFAWSPDSRMLMIETKGDRNFLSAIEVATSRLLSFPLPREERHPAGIPLWWDEWEVLFVRPDGDAQALDLLKLRLHSISTSRKGHSLGKTEISLLRAFPSHLPVAPKWKAQVEARVLGYTVPISGSSDWSVRESMQLALVDSTNPYRGFLSEFDVRVDDDFLGTTDSTRLIRIRDNQALICFLGLRESHITRYRGTIRELPEHVSPDEFTNSSVAGFVCAPLINPLNGKTVGADRTAVKGIARIAQWQKESAEFWIEEEYAPIVVGDVISDFHLWTDRKPHGIAELGSDEVFAVIEAEIPGAPPKLTDRPPLERAIAPVIQISYGSDHVVAAAPPRTNKAPEPSQLPALAEKPPDPPAKPPPSQPVPNPPPATSSAPRPEPSPVATEELRRAQMIKTIAAFIYEHHAKSNRNDISGMASDFAAKTDYFGNVDVTRDFVRKQETSERKPGIRRTETVVSPPTVTFISGTRYKAAYPMRYVRSSPFGVINDFTLDLERIVDVTSGSPQIVRSTGSRR